MDNKNIIIETKCHNCGKSIKIELPKEYVEVLTCFTCNNCVPKNSPARNNVEEAFYTEYEGGRV